MNIDLAILNNAIYQTKNGGTADKKVAIYSHKASVLLRYLQLSKPKFSRSRAAKEKLIAIISDEHEELWNRIVAEIPLSSKTDKTDSEWTGPKRIFNQPDTKTLRTAISETYSQDGKSTANDNRIITIYSPQLAALFKYLDQTTIRFKTSAYGAEILERSLEEEYPKLCNKIQKRINT